MHYSGNVYTPPAEASTVLLQATSGCSYNQCRFCGMYGRLSFKISPMSEIVADLETLQYQSPDADRIFLIHGDAFVLNYDQLRIIVTKIKKYLPKVKTIAMFASISNIKDKTDDQLNSLLHLGINDLIIGIESGSDEVLTAMNKGHTSADIIKQSERLSRVGINYTCSLVMGLAGKGSGIKNAIETAHLINQLNPSSVAISGLTIFPNSQLAEDVRLGEFIESTEYEMVEELITLIEHLEIETFLDATHNATTIRVSGAVPKDKSYLIAKLRNSLTDFNEKVLRRRRERYMSIV